MLSLSGRNGILAKEFCSRMAVSVYSPDAVRGHSLSAVAPFCYYKEYASYMVKSGKNEIIHAKSAVHRYNNNENDFQ